MLGHGCDHGQNQFLLKREVENRGEGWGVKGGLFFAPRFSHSFAAIFTMLSLWKTFRVITIDTSLIFERPFVFVFACAIAIASAFGTGLIWHVCIYIICEKYILYVKNIYYMWKKVVCMTGDSAPRYPPGLRHCGWHCGLYDRELCPPLSPWPTAPLNYCWSGWSGRARQLLAGANRHRVH